MVIDALGNEIVVGHWYGYSNLGGGISHVTLGRVKTLNAETGKIRLENCIVNRYIYGEPTDYRKDEIPRDVTIRGAMVFPIPNQTKETI